MSLLDDVSIVVTPNGYKAGELYAVIPVPNEGAEQVVNGDFATDTDWNKGTGWTIANGKTSSDGNGGSFIYQSISSLTTGDTLKVVYEIVDYTSGEVRIGVGSGFSQPYGIYRSALGTYTEYITKTSSDTTFGFVNNSGNSFIGSITNVSVKEYTSADMDVTRATAATRVDENGLVNYAEVLGGELVVRGDFSNSSDWDLSYGTSSTTWSISDGKANATNSVAYDRIAQTNTIPAGTYKITINISNYTSGTLIPIVAGQLGTQFPTSVGVHSQYITGGGSGQLLAIASNPDFTGSIDNVSVKEVDRDNVPRIDYTGGGCPHILAEPQRTNQSLNSNDISQLSTIISGGSITVTGNYAVSPDGTQDATRVVASSTGSNYALVSSTAVTSTAGAYVGSIYLKSNNGSNQNVAFYGRNTSVNYVTITPNWERYNVLGSVSSNFINFGARPSFGSDSSLDFLAWGLQIEHGSYATSLIPTSGSAVTRNQDQFTRDGIGSLINSTEGVLFVEMAALSDDSTFRGISISDGTYSNRCVLRYGGASNRLNVLVVSGGSSVFDSNSILSNIKNFSKIAIKWKANDFAFWVNGVEVVTSTSGNAPIGLSQLQFADSINSSTFLFGKVKQLQVYKTALTDNQLIQLTGEAGTHFFESYAEMASALTYTIQ